MRHLFTIVLFFAVACGGNAEKGHSGPSDATSTGDMGEAGQGPEMLPAVDCDDLEQAKDPELAEYWTEICRPCSPKEAANGAC